MHARRLRRLLREHPAEPLTFLIADAYGLPRDSLSFDHATALRWAMTMLGADRNDAEGILLVYEARRRSEHQLTCDRADRDAGREEALQELADLGQLMQPEDYA